MLIAVVPIVFTSCVLFTLYETFLFQQISHLAHWRQ